MISTRHWHSTSTKAQNAAWGVGRLCLLSEALYYPGKGMTPGLSDKHLINLEGNTLLNVWFSHTISNFSVLIRSVKYSKIMLIWDMLLEMNKCLSSRKEDTYSLLRPFTFRFFVGLNICKSGHLIFNVFSSKQRTLLGIVVHHKFFPLPWTQHVVSRRWRQPNNTVELKRVEAAWEISRFLTVKQQISELKPHRYRSDCSHVCQLRCRALAVRRQRCLRTSRGKR